MSLDLERQKTVESVQRLTRTATVASVKQDEQTIKDYQNRIYSSAKPKFTKESQIHRYLYRQHIKHD